MKEVVKTEAFWIKKRGGKRGEKKSQAHEDARETIFVQDGENMKIKGKGATGDVGSRPD